MKIGIDIGGTLIKMIVDADSGAADLSTFAGQYSLVQFKPIKIRDRVLHKIIITRKNIDQFWELLVRLKPYLIDGQINATGGGAFCYQQQFGEKGFALNIVSEFDALIKGLFNLIEAKPDSFYSLEQADFRQCLFAGEICPSLIVNLGSGFSFNIIKSRKEHFPVGGSSFGGSTIIGYAAKMFGVVEFNAIVSIFENVDAKIASLSNPSNTEPAEGDKMLKALKNNGSFMLSESAMSSLSSEQYRDVMIYGFLVKILCNVTDLAFAQAKSMGLGRVFFAGSFIDNGLSMQRVIARRLAVLCDKYGHSVKVR